MPPVTSELTSDGFLLRASCRSFFDAAFRIFFAGLLGAIPFVLWSDLISGLPTDEGMSFWLTSAFLAAWAGAVLYIIAVGIFLFFGEIRIAKSGDGGKIFKGIGNVGRTHRFLWSEVRAADEEAVAEVSGGRFDRTIHCIGLSGTSRRYRFGFELTPEQRAFIIAFLREHALTPVID